MRYHRHKIRLQAFNALEQRDVMQANYELALALLRGQRRAADLQPASFAIRQAQQHLALILRGGGFARVGEVRRHPAGAPAPSQIAIEMARAAEDVAANGSAHLSRITPAEPRP